MMLLLMEVVTCMVESLWRKIINRSNHVPISPILINLPENQMKILSHIALNGPNDAYRTHNELNLCLSTTQLAFTKLKNLGCIQLKEMVKGDTEQIRKIYSLGPLGFCIITRAMLEPKTITTYNDLKTHIDLNGEFFPDLLKKWDFFIEKSREYHLRNPVKGWKSSSFMISMPDAATEIWCQILNSVCDSLIKDYEWWAKTITLKDISEKFRETLINFIWEDASSEMDGAMIFALKQNRELWDALTPELSGLIEYHKERITLLEKIICE